tara:strand:+ start:2682 stop:3647 length:966 start_codon:yes stop_codon:yes gene_type:complete
MDLDNKTLILFKSFISDICKVFPEHKESIDTNYSDILESNEITIVENETISEFLRNIDENSNGISNKSIDIFTEELFLIKDISMKAIWNSDISDKTKENIWKYLQGFCVINISRNSNDKINEVLKSIESNEKVTDKQTVKEINKIKKINENLKNSDNEEEQNDKKEKNDIEDLVDNTSIGNLAKEITENMGFKDGSEPDISDLMKPENMMNMFQTINTTLNDKINNKELDMNNLFGEASGLMNNNDMMKGMMGMISGMSNSGENSGGPDLSSMMSMFQNMQQPNTQSNTQSNTRQSSNSSTGPHDPEIVKERLRNKLNKNK